MTISDLNRYALTVFSLVTLLASCNSGGSLSQVQCSRVLLNRA